VSQKAMVGMFPRAPSLMGCKQPIYINITTPATLRDRTAQQKTNKSSSPKEISYMNYKSNFYFLKNTTKIRLTTKSNEPKIKHITV